MTVLTLTSTRQRPLRSLIEAALYNELRLLRVAMQRTEQRLNFFETQYGLSTDEFIRRYEDDDLPETLDFAQWVGEHRLLERLRDKVETLQEIQIED